VGYYQCIRCGGGDIYTSEENGRTFALTLDTPSAVDPTMLHTMKQTVTRCKACGEKSNYIYTEEDHAASKVLVAKISQGLSAAMIVLAAAFSFYIWANSNPVGTGRVDWIFWLGLSLTVVGVLRIAFLLSGSTSIRIKLSISYWSTAFISLSGFALLPWDFDWVRPTLHALSLIVFVYIAFIFGAIKRTEVFVYLISALPVIAGMYSWLNWDSDWAGLLFLFLAIAAVVSIVIFLLRVNKSPTTPSLATLLKTLVR
jgi:hypothetical protein